MKSVDRLDWLLNLLNNTKGGISDGQILKIYKESFPQDEAILNKGQILIAMLNKLVKDGFARVVKDDKPDNVMPGRLRLANQYYIEFDGMLFIEQGGYKAKERNERSKKTLIDFQSWIIAVGTIAGGAYAIKGLITSEIYRIILLSMSLSTLGTGLCLILYQRYKK